MSPLPYWKEDGIILPDIDEVDVNRVHQLPGRVYQWEFPSPEAKIIANTKMRIEITVTRDY